MKAAKPRSGWGGCPPSILGETWMDAEGPGRRARVRMPDGRLRVIRVGQVADTFFTVPAAHGFVSIKTLDGQSADAEPRENCEFAYTRYQDAR